MPQLHKLRKGWEKEHLAKFILSKFCFISEPSTISDDVGTDILCTLFKIKDSQFLIPQNSFAIQIKSNKKDIDVGNKRNYLTGLELPYFVGVISEDEKLISIYAGEYISDFFSSSAPSMPTVKKICIKLIEERPEPLEMWKERRGKLSLYFPKVIDIPFDFDYIKNPEKIEGLFEICKMMQDNISSKTSNGFVFKKFKSNFVHIYAGAGSAQTFRNNYNQRLAEVFFNLRWQYENISKTQARNLIKKEFEIYKKHYAELISLEGDLPEYLKKIYLEADKVIR